MVIKINLLISDSLLFSYDEVIKLNPKYKETWNNKGKILKH